MRFMEFVRQFHGEESGQDMLEYALVVLAVLVAVVAGSANLSGTLSGELTNIDGKISGLTLP